MLRKCHLELGIFFQVGVTSTLKIPDEHLACEIIGKKVQESVLMPWNF